MGSFKNLFMLMMVSSSTLFGFSLSVKTIPQRDFALLKRVDEACYQELNQKIKDILNISKLKISKNSFSSDSHLYLTNQKSEPFSHKSPIQSYYEADRIFLLHYKKGKLFISLVDHDNRALKSEALSICQSNSKAVK